MIELKQTQGKLIQIEKEKEAENIRLRISRDIHDDIGGNLTKIALLSDITASNTQQNSPETLHTLSRISDYSRNVNTSLSEIVWAITPKHDSLDSLLVFMRAHIHKMFEGAGITYQINFPEQYQNHPLHPDLKRNIFLVLKESLNNILKYAQAKNVDVSFSIDGDNFEMKIKDDGIGFDLHQKQETGNGLQNMKFRAEQSNGVFSIHSKPNSGTEIIASGLLF